MKVPRQPHPLFDARLDQGECRMAIWKRIAVSSRTLGLPWPWLWLVIAGRTATWV